MVSEILTKEEAVRTGRPVVVQVRDRGQFTIPAEIRREMGIQEGDVFTLIRLGETLIATRKRLVAPEVAEAIEALMREERITLEDLLEGLEEERRKYVEERYGIEA